MPDHWSSHHYLLIVFIYTVQIDKMVNQLTIWINLLHLYLLWIQLILYLNIYLTVFLRLRAARGARPSPSRATPAGLPHQR